MQEKIIDARGLACPQPVIATKKAMQKYEGGQLITIVDNKTALENIQKLAAGQGFSNQVEEKSGEFYVYLTREKAPLPNRESPEEAGRKTVVFITRRHLGQGAEELGEGLMKSFLYTLTEREEEIKHIIFMNSGVFLSTSDSPVLDYLKDLEAKGIGILSCGTCLDFYGLKEKLQAGQVTNMFDAVDILLQAKKIISL